MLTPRLLLALALLPIFARAEAPSAQIIETKIISPQLDLYHGWPTVVRRQNGELWLTWSGGRESHVCPFGQVCAMTSRDEGKTWTFPRVLLDSATDDRDSGVLETAKGTLLATTFTSLAYEDSFKKATMMAEHTDKGWVSKTMPPERYARWKAAHERLNDEERKAALDAGYDLDRVLTHNDLVATDNCFFAATGITDGELVKGVHFNRNGCTTESLVMRSRSGTVRLVQAHHRLDKINHFGAGQD